MRILSVFLFLIGSVEFLAESLKIYSIIVPQHAFNGKSAILQCRFSLDNKELLYAVRWYKDDEEFFRFVPRFKPSILSHQVPGVNVVEEESSNQMVTLNPVEMGSTGVYRCEVSAEAPKFISAEAEGRMNVVYLPTEEPQITGLMKNEYEVGDMLELNCISSKSSPPAKLQWWLNDIQITEPWVSAHDEPIHRERFGGGNNHSSYSSSFATSSSSNDHLSSTQLRLRIELRPDHFGPNGIVKVRCRARIDLDDYSHKNHGSNNRHMMDNSWNNDNDPRYDSSYQEVHDMREHSSLNSHRSRYLDERETLLIVRSSSTVLLISLQLIFAAVTFTFYTSWMASS